MTTDPPERPVRPAAKPADAMTRDERRKAALKANMARRKAQARARQSVAGDADGQAGAGSAGDNDNEGAQ